MLPFSGTARSSSIRCPSRSPAPGRCWSGRSPAASAVRTCTRASTPIAWSSYAEAFPRPQADGPHPRRRVRPRILLRDPRLRSGDAAQAEAGHAGLLAAGAADADGAARHRLFQRQYRRLCRAHAAQRSAAAGSAERAGGGTCGAHRTARGRRPRGRQGQCARRRGAAGDRLRPGRACGHRRA